MASLRRLVLALALVAPLAAGCRSLDDLAPRRSDSVPTKAVKVIVLVPVVAVGFCLVLVAAVAHRPDDPTIAAPRPAHPDFAPGPLHQIR